MRNESASEVVGALRFLTGLLAKMTKKETQQNLANLTSALEAG